MVKVNYNKTTGDILGYYPDNIGYASIPEPYIEIDEATHLDCINNQGKRKVDLTTLKIIECEATTATLDELKTSKLSEISTWTKSHIIGGFTSNAKGSKCTYDSDEDTQSTITIAYNASRSSDFETSSYKGQVPIRAIPDGQTEKIIINHNASEMQTLINDLALHIGTCKQKGWTLQSAVSAATTKEQLEAIVWAE